MSTIKITVFGPQGTVDSEVTTDGDVDFALHTGATNLQVKRAVTPAFVERAERAAMNAMVQATRAEHQAAAASISAGTAEATAATLAGMVEAAKPARRKTTRRKR